jgi:hypothetical protein
LGFDSYPINFTIDIGSNLMLKKDMAREVPQELLDSIFVRRPDIVDGVNAVEDNALEAVLYRQASRILHLYGDYEKGQPKDTDAWILRVGTESVKLHFLENPDCALRAELLPKTSGNEEERGVLDITIRERGSLWGEDLITTGQLRTALGLTMYLEKLGFEPPLDRFTKDRLGEESRLPFRDLQYGWGMRAREEELYRQGWNGF